MAGVLVGVEEGSLVLVADMLVSVEEGSLDVRGVGVFSSTPPIDTSSALVGSGVLEVLDTDIGVGYLRVVSAFVRGSISRD